MRISSRTMERIARLHPKNWHEDNWEYPQLWYCWPIFMRRRLARTVKEWICERLTGHEFSRTEWGYGGGRLVDQHCRWCDKFFQVPFDESKPLALVSELVDSVGRENFG